MLYKLIAYNDIELQICQSPYTFYQEKKRLKISALRLISVKVHNQVYPTLAKEAFKYALLLRYITKESMQLEGKDYIIIHINGIGIIKSVDMLYTKHNCKCKHRISS
jgi:hypothetical protein